MNYELRAFKILKKKSLFISPIILYSLFLIPNSFAAEIPQDLKNAINEKTKELQVINQKILETQKGLDETEGKSKTLKKELSQIDQRLGQLNLNIRASEINIEKLRLEVQSLDYNLKEIRSSITTTKSAITKLLMEILKKDREPILITLLKSSSLAQSLDEFQYIQDLNSTLSGKINELKKFDKDVSENLDATSQKKQKVEIENGSLKNKKSSASQQKEERQTLLQTTKNQERLFTQQITKLKKLQLEVSSEVEKIEAELRKKIDPKLLPIPRPGVLTWPVTLKDQSGYGRITQKWGIPSSLYGGKAHNGLDIGAPIGTPIFAAEKGKVIEVWNQDRYCYKGAYGKFIVIEHENNLTTLYAHLSTQNVSKGDIVERGQLIGAVGSTGYATGPHLHLTLYATQTFIIRPSKVNCGPIMPFGGDLDPLQYL